MSGPAAYRDAHVILRGAGAAEAERGDGAPAVARQPPALAAICAGSVYNRAELCRALGQSEREWTGVSSAAAVLRAYARWGVQCVERLRGEWAFLVWDAAELRLFGARDPAGVHSLFYFWDGETLVAADRILDVVAHPAVPREPDWAHLAYYLAAEVGHHAMGEATCFARVRRLPPGCTLRVRPGHVQVVPYWRLDPVRAIRFDSDGAYGEAFRDVLTAAVSDRLQDGAGVGANLSGGLDSSAIVTLAAAARPASAPPLPTFSALFSGVAAYDERAAVEAVVNRTRAESHVLTLDDAASEDARESFFAAHGEPTIGFSALVLWMLKRCAAASGVRAVLNGIGADELLGGSLHCLADLLRRGRLAALGRELAAYQRYDAFHHRASSAALFWRFGLRPLVPSWMRAARHRLFPPALPPWISRGFAAETQLAARLASSPPPRFADAGDQQQFAAICHTYTPHLLSYEEAGAKACGLESRSPFLDPRVVEFAFAVPREQKFRDGVPKVVLRTAMGGALPEAIRGNPVKTGIPRLIDAWQTGPYRSHIEQSLRDGLLADAPVFTGGGPADALAAYLAGRHELRGLVWKLFHLENWLRRHVRCDAAKTGPAAS